MTFAPFHLGLLLALATLSSLLNVSSHNVFNVSTLNAADALKALRRPVAVTISTDGRWLYTANRDSGTICIVETQPLSITRELSLGGRLTDLAMLDDHHLLVLDQEQHQVLLLTGAGSDWNVSVRTEVPRFPVRLVIDAQSRRFVVASLWSRRLTVMDLAMDGPHPALRVVRTLSLPFEPREMCLVPDHSALIVAGSFESQLAVVDTKSWKLVAVKEIPGHNVRGLAVSGDGSRIFVSQQTLNPLGHSSRDDVHWGNMLSNLLVTLPAEQLCDPGVEMARHRVELHLGKPGRGAGDPGPIIVGPDGTMAILLSGVHEVALWSAEDSPPQRVPVGVRPSAAVFGPGNRLLVTNQYSDSVSAIDISIFRQTDEVSLGPMRQPNLAELGEQLFFDSRLSHDGWLSCHSCHTDGHSNGGLNDNLSDGSFDTPKRVVSLLGVGSTGPWAWNGKMETLRQQIRSSVARTMQGETPSETEVAAMAAFLRTLAAPPPTEFAIMRDEEKVQRGATLFRALNCHQCHEPPTYTSLGVYDVGITDSSGNRLFNPPSLRAVSRRRGLLHDARAASLVDVLTQHEHPLPRSLSSSELEALVQFLNTL